MYNNNRTPAVWTKFASSNNLNISFSEKGGVKLTRTTIDGKEQLICFIKGDDLGLLINGAEAISKAQEHYETNVVQAKEQNKAKEYAKKQVAKAMENQIKNLQASLDALKMAGVAETDLTVVTLRNTIATLTAKAA